MRTSETNTIEEILRLVQEKEFQIAAAKASALVAAHPNNHICWNLLGGVLYHLGAYDDAIRAFQRSIRHKEGDPVVYNNLGAAFLATGYFNQAKQFFLEAIKHNPYYAAAHSNLGNVFKELGRSEEAITHYLHALTLDPSYAEAHHNLGNIYLECGRFGAAGAAFREAIKLDPRFADAYLGLGNTLHTIGSNQSALEAYRKGIEINPFIPNLYYNLGNLCLILSLLSEAVHNFRQAIKLKADFSKAHNNLGTTLLSFGLEMEAKKHLDLAVSCDPNDFSVHSSRIFIYDLFPDISEREAQDLRRKSNLFFSKNMLDRSNDLRKPFIKASSSKLRIGYVSADFCKHSAANVFGSMLTHFNRSDFEVYCYSNAYDNPRDIYTSEFISNATVWRNIKSLLDEAAINLIRDDRIDILVDLSSHSAGNRLGIFAARAAPIQITAWGYVGGTGIANMDYCFVDKVVVPVEERQYLTETAVDLDSFIGGFLFLEEFPEVLPRTSIECGPIRFGSFSRTAKINSKVIKFWCEVLNAFNGSTLLLKAPVFSDPAVCSQFYKLFEVAGLSRDRLEIRGKTDWYSHMDCYNDIDVSLDTFPHNGGVTTIESLMMGVPVMTLCHPRIFGRMSSSVNRCLGLDNWIGITERDFLGRLNENLADRALLRGLKHGLRAALCSAKFFNKESYVQTVEKSYVALASKQSVF